MSKSYWNDVEQEKNKPYFIEDEEDPKLLNFLQRETNLQKCFEDALQFASNFGCIRGRILEIGAGVAWTSAIMTKIPDVIEVSAIDFSEHRLLKIGPIVFRQLNGDISKFRPVLGDFLNMDFDTGKKYDAVVFCQALYMFSNIYKVLHKTHSLLHQGGVVIVACERIISPPNNAWDLFRSRIRNIFFDRADCTGNNFYTDEEYKKAIQSAGFKYSIQNLTYSIYPGSGINAVNHFGIAT